MEKVKSGSSYITTVEWNLSFAYQLLYNDLTSLLHNDLMAIPPNTWGMWGNSYLLHMFSSFIRLAWVCSYVTAKRQEPEWYLIKVSEFTCFMSFR